MGDAVLQSVSRARLCLLRRYEKNCVQNLHDSLLNLLDGGKVRVTKKEAIIQGSEYIALCKLPTAAWRNGNASDYDLVIRRLQVRPLRWSIACFWDFFWRSPAHPRAVRRKCCSRPTYMLLPSDVQVTAVRCICCCRPAYMLPQYNTSRSLDPTSTTPSSCAMVTAYQTRWSRAQSAATS